MTSNTFLLRQVHHPTFVQDGRATSQAFVPTEKDANQLSVDDGDQVTPLVSWERYTVTFGPPVCQRREGSWFPPPLAACESFVIAIHALDTRQRLGGRPPRRDRFKFDAVGNQTGCPSLSL